MVVKIMQPASSSCFSLEYNENKCSNGEASLLHSQNIDEARGIEETFQMYERRNIRTQNLSFHMSVNPSPEENLSEAEMKRFVGDLMEGLGFGNQPYVIYKHTDIDRDHYHVVSVRVDEHGHKIRDFQENRRCQKLLVSLAPQYQLTVGNSDSQRNMETGINPKRFNPSIGNIMEQIRIITQECCKYHMTSFEQFQYIMYYHGLEVQDRPGDTSQLVIRGINQDGVPCTAPITEQQLGRALYSDYEKRAVDCLGRSGTRYRERGRITGITATCLEHSTSEKHFRNMLAKFDIDVHLHRDRSGNIHGATFVDHSTKCAFKGSELGSFKLADVVAADQGGQWQHRSEPTEKQGKSSCSGVLAAAVGGISKGGSKSREKDMKVKKKKHKLKR